MATHFGHSGYHATNHSAVGLSGIDLERDFKAVFRGHYARLLGKRAEGFAALFAAMERVVGPLLVIETGTLRLPGNWEGDGQSTYMFDVQVQSAAHRGREASLFSIDLDPASIAAARVVCSSATNLICNDSVFALATLARQMAGRRVTLLYLDSFDLDHRDPLPSATHHMMELVSAAPLLGPGSLVAVDDYEIEGVTGGKGLLVDRYMESVGAAVVYAGYQKIWQLR